jgi:Family of unknown function (DUF6325)
VQSRTYEVTFAGEAGDVVLAEFDDCEVSVGPGATTLRLEIPDQGALYGLLHRIASFGLELIDVSVVAPPADVRHEDSKCRQAQFSPAKGTIMTEVSLDELGPVDYLVVEFPAGASSFTGEMAAELRALADSGTIRVIDVLILTKGTDGTVEAAELSDIAELGDLQAIEAELAELLAADDVDHLAAAMEPGSTAGVLIWENLWAAPFASAVRRSGGQLIANGRIPIQAIIASIEADQVTATVGD